ncbi:MAG: IS110 family transposase [Rhodothalassiaceae bacterium]
MTQTIIGIDVSKDHLDAHRLADGRDARFTNDRAGHRALVRWIAAAPSDEAAKVVYEPTGAYHRAMEGALAKAGLALVKVNPARARRFAQAAGAPAKTDRLDAQMLARMAQALELPVRPVADERLAALRELLRARRGLVRDRVAAKNREHTLTIDLLKRQTAQRLAQIDRHIEQIDAQIRALISQDPALEQRFQILTSIPGIGAQIACAILIDLPEIGQIEPRKLTSLAGLAPRTRQSGKWQGKAFVWGGRKPLRDALYMPALVACRFNPDMKAKYHQLIANGKPPKVAITAIMRKLIVLANALIRNHRKWAPKTA